MATTSRKSGGGTASDGSGKARTAPWRKATAKVAAPRPGTDRGRAAASKAGAKAAAKQAEADAGRGGGGPGPHVLWKGYLKLSLVSCAVAVIPAATSTGKVSFYTLNRATGNRVRRRYVDSVTGDPVEPDDQVKGYRIGKDRYLTITEEELDGIQLESSHTIDIGMFVPRDEIDPVWLDGSHYVVPDDPVAVEAYSVIREAMRQQDLVGIGRVVLHRRERRCVLQPHGRGILLTALYFPYEIRSDEEVFADLADPPLSPALLRLVDELVEGRCGAFEPDAFTDRFQEAALALIEAKRRKKPLPKAPEAPEPGKVINLMDALKRSIAAERKGGATGPAPGRAHRRTDRER